MAPILLLGLIAFLSSLCLWLGDRLRLPVPPLLLLTGTALSQLMPGQLTWNQLFTVLGVTVCLSFFEGGLVMGSRKLELAGYSKKLVAICSKLGWVLLTALCGPVLGLTPALSLLVAAMLMVFSPKSVSPLVSRLGGGPEIEELLYGECYLVSCVGCAWAALMVLVANAHHNHPGVLETLMSTTRLFLLGATIGYLGARALGAALHSGAIPDRLREPICLSWVLLCYGSAHALLPGAGLVASVILGKTLSRRKVELALPFYVSLQTVLVGLLGIALGMVIPLGDLLHGPVRLIGFALLVLLVRPVLVMAALFRQKLSPVQRFNLWAVAPRGIVTLGVAGTAAQMLGPEILPEALKMPAIVYWVVLTTNLVPWLLSIFIKPSPEASPS